MTEREGTTWIGKPVPRREDAPLTAGAGTYMADIDLPGMVHMAVLRSPHAHARLRSISMETARRDPSVHAVLAAEDLPESIQPLPILWKLPGQKEDGITILAKGKVRYVGEPVAVVIADSPYAAEDALELIEVEYEPLPAVTDPERAMGTDAPLVNEEWGDNIAIDLPFRGGDADAAFADAPIVVTGRFYTNRYSGVPLETRGSVASWDSLSKTLTVWSASQVASRLRTELASSMDLPENAIRVLTPNIGGAFGVKWDRYSEDLLVCFASQLLGRPVKWIEDRREHFQATVHAREQIQDWELAVSEDGKILALRGRIICDLGARLSSVGIGPAWVSGATMPNQYKFDHYSANVIAVATNKVPSSSYRGFGGPEANFGIERLMDKAARRLGLDPAEFRRQNLIQPDDFPYASPSGAFYDSGNYPETIRLALEKVDYPRFRKDQAELREKGIYRGIGISCYVHCTGFGPSAILGAVSYDTSGYEGTRVQVDPSGKVTVYTGMIPLGQGTETTLAQVAADRFGVDLADVRVVWGDTSQTPYTGFGSGGSRSNLAVVAILKAVDEIKAKMVRIAAHTLEANPDDIEFVDGSMGVRGVPGASLTIPEVARIAHLAHNLPEGEQPMLQASHVFDPPSFSWAYGCHIGVVDVDIQTGTLKWVRYVVIDDCGPLINPMIVEGQIHGGVAQGIGGALLERYYYDESGQLLTTSFMDYLLPSFHDVPRYEIAHVETPAPHIEGGFKGMGEAGSMSPAAVVANAVSDALAPFGVEVDSLPVTPSYLWSLLRDAGATDPTKAELA